MEPASGLLYAVAFVTVTLALTFPVLALRGLRRYARDFALWLFAAGLLTIAVGNMTRLQLLAEAEKSLEYVAPEEAPALHDQAVEETSQPFRLAVVVGGAASLVAAALFVSSYLDSRAAAKRGQT